jgi:hypothetical protein
MEQLIDTEQIEVGDIFQGRRLVACPICHRRKEIESKVILSICPVCMCEMLEEEW